MAPMVEAEAALQSCCCHRRLLFLHLHWNWMLQLVIIQAVGRLDLMLLLAQPNVAAFVVKNNRTNSFFFSQHQEDRDL